MCNLEAILAVNGNGDNVGCPFGCQFVVATNPELAL